MLWSVLTGLGIAIISPAATLGAELCAHRSPTELLGEAFFAIAIIASFPGFVAGWFAVNVIHATGWAYPLIATYLLNWLIYSLITSRLLRTRSVQIG
jgi:hypothetical protein